MKSLSLLNSGFALALATAVLLGVPAARADGSVPILRFEQVSPGIYRGAHPGPEGLAALARLGIKYDLNLDNDDAQNAEELDAARALGIQVYAQPMSGFWSPDDAQVDAIEKLIADPANRPLFIHCQHGQDRTGLIVGLHRVEHEGWTPAAAYQEMLRIGFHPELFLLNHYFEERTGFED